MRMNRQSAGRKRNVDSAKCGSIIVVTNSSLGSFVTLPKRHGTTIAQSDAAAMPLGTTGHVQLCTRVSYQ